MSFHVGQKVVCVDADQTRWDGIVELIKGQVYTIRWIGTYVVPEWGDGWDTDEVCVKLAEVPRRHDGALPHDRRADDMPFRVARFRPVIERKRKTDIAIFNRLLTPASNGKVSA